MDMDTALERLGTFGKWQIGIFLIISFTIRFPGLLNILSIIYIGHAPEHHCKIAEGASINDSIPHLSNGKLSQCLKYLNLSISNQTMGCDGGWDYDPNDSYTIVNEWDLVCDRRILVNVSQTILCIGYIMGNFLASIISDIFGRKLIFLTSQMLILVLGISCAFIQDFYIFIVFRFLLGMLQQAGSVSGWVFLSEMYPTKHRTFIGINTCLFCGLAATTMPFFAFFLQNWRHLQIVINLFGIFSFPLLCYMPESARWLQANDRTKEAEEVIRFAARINNVVMPDLILGNVESENEETYFKEKLTFFERIKHSFSQESSKKKCTKQYSIWDLFRNSMLLRHLAITSYLRVVNVWIFYGLVFSSGDMLGNRFLDGFFNSFVELPAVIISYPAAKRFGRKKPITVFLAMTVIFLLIIPFVLKTKVSGTDVYLSTIFSILSKFGISGSFYIEMIYTLELFPTNLRSRAVGTMSLISVIGFVAANFMGYFMKLYMGYIFISSSILVFLAALSIQFLPETNNRPLPETIEEIEAWKHEIPKDSSELDEKSHVLSEKSKDNENKYVTSTE